MMENQKGKQVKMHVHNGQHCYNCNMQHSYTCIYQIKKKRLQLAIIIIYMQHIRTVTAKVTIFGPLPAHILGCHRNYSMLC